MKNQIIIILLFICSCNAQTKNDPKTFITSIDTISEEINKVANEKIMAIIMDKDDSIDDEKQRDEINILFTKSIKKVESLDEINEKMDLKKKMLTYLNTSHDLINHEDFNFIIKLKKKELTQDNLNESIDKVGKGLEIVNKLLPKITTLMKQAEQLEITIQEYHDFYKVPALPH